MSLRKDRTADYRSSLIWGAVGIMLTSVLHSATAQDTDRIKEKRLRAAYCVGFFEVRQATLSLLCATTTDATMQQTCPVGLMQGRAKLDRLMTYLSATSSPGDSSVIIAREQGRRDKTQCGSEAISATTPCWLACVKGLPRPPSESDLNACLNRCTSDVCKHADECWNFDPW